MRMSIKKKRKSRKIGLQQTLIDAISGFMTDFLRFIDVNAGGFRLKRARQFDTHIFTKELFGWFMIDHKSLSQQVAAWDAILLCE